MSSWKWNSTMGGDSLAKLVGDALEEITVDQAIDSEAGGDSEAEDEISFNNVSLGSTNSFQCTSNNAQGTSTAVESDSHDSVLDKDYIPSDDLPNNAISDDSSYTDTDRETSDNFDDDYQWSKQGNNPQAFSSAQCPPGIGIKCEVDINCFSKIFMLFFSTAVLQHIVSQSNLYANQGGVNLDLCEEELKAYLGILIIMGFHSLPAMKLYWSTNLNFYVDRVASVMPLKRFLKITRYIHLNDNAIMPGKDSPDFDKLYKLRPLIDMLNSSFYDCFSPSRFLSIDESMIGYKGRSTLKQYMPMKPIKRGFKVWVLCCAVTGYMLSFQIYEGKSKTNENLPLGERVVLELSEAFQFLGYCLFFDNFFTSIPLLSKLITKGLFACGTLRQTRKYFPKAHLRADKDLRAGQSDFVTCDDISVYKWKDRGTKCVTIGSTMHDARKRSSVRRTNKEGNKEEVECPEAIKDYNMFMGGVDRFDHLHSCYSVAWKSRRWWMKVFYYLLDACIVNSYILYRETVRLKDNKLKPVTHLEFRSTLANELIGNFCGRTRRGARPKMEKQNSMKKPTVGRPKKTGVGLGYVGERLPVPGTWRRCAYCSRGDKQKRSNLICQKCEVALCKSCFHQFHTAS